MENVEYLEIIMTGTKLLTVKEFYDYCDELKSSSKDKLPLFLYSFNLIDKFTFSKFKDSNTIVRINNNNQNTHTKLNIGEYLLQNVIYQKDIFELKNIVDSDLRLEISENELVIYAAGELKECFTILNKSKLDVEFAVKELICESWLECIVNFRQVANYVEDWSDTDYIISLFSNINNEVVEEIKQCKELLFKVMHSMIKEMKRCPSTENSELV
ncbi:hypothetical protein [Streptococcus pluranimalium]|uniref:hypothetical protein n=1 Tax=Streptococcus pluranimalium TaxID=82348 RepID=UPI003F693286